MRKSHNILEKNRDWVAKSLQDSRRQHAENISRSSEGREIRRQNMARRNQSDTARETSSRIAKVTSSRPEILERRSLVLKKWRENNAEDFYNKCTSKMHGRWQSTPEMRLGDLLREMSDYSFSYNQVVKSEMFTWKSKRKQVDYADKSRRVYIEFDGFHHFNDFKGNSSDAVRVRDRLLDQHIISNGWTLVRISHDQFTYSGGGKFLEECIEKLKKILRDCTPGIHLIGNCYESNK